MVRKSELQVQIGVSRSLKKDMTCSFYTGKYPEEARAPKATDLLKPGEWNRIRLEAAVTGELANHPMAEISRATPREWHRRNFGSTSERSLGRASLVIETGSISWGTLELTEAGIVLEDRPNGTCWSRK